MSAPGRRPRGLDLSRPSVARVYDYLLGGKDHFAVDRQAGKEVERIFPEAPQLARANRRFAARAASWCARRGLRQFIDIGTGLPTSPSLFEVVPAERRDAVVVGVDNDPHVLVHDRALLEDTGQPIRILEGDVRQPGRGP